MLTDYKNPWYTVFLNLVTLKDGGELSLNAGSLFSLGKLWPFLLSSTEGLRCSKREIIPSLSFCSFALWIAGLTF